LNLLNKYRITELALIISFSLISGGEFWHHHNDVNYDESQCPVCLIIHSFIGTDANFSPEIVKPATFEIINITQNPVQPESRIQSVLSDRAPPSTI